MPDPDLVRRADVLVLALLEDDGSTEFVAMRDAILALPAAPLGERLEAALALAEAVERQSQDSGLSCDGPVLYALLRYRAAIAPDPATASGS